jgi:hypothetical protein
MTQAGRSPLDPWIDSVIGSEIEDEDPVSERRTLLVDGFNVLHTVLLAGDRDSIWWGRDAREKLLARICAWPDPRDEIWVAFDGSQPAWSVLAVPAGLAAGGGGPTVHSIFVESADDWIVRRARRAPLPARVLVVSADRKVAGRARSAGCEVWTPWAFVARCVVPSEGPRALPGPRAQPPDAPVGDDGSPAPRPPPNVVS